VADTNPNRSHDPFRWEANFLRQEYSNYAKPLLLIDDAPSRNAIWSVIENENMQNAMVRSDCIYD
jgi:hypothetical protein